MRIPNLKCPKSATPDEQRIVAAYNLGKANKVCVRGVVYAAEGVPDSKSLPQGLSMVRVGRMPWGAPFADGQGARYCASRELGRQFVEVATPALKFALGGRTFEPKAKRPRHTTSINGLITTQSLLETLYTHNSISVDDVVRMLRNILNASLQQLTSVDGVDLLRGKTIRIAQGALEPVGSFGKLTGFTGVSMKSRRYKALSSGLCVPTEVVDAHGGATYSITYKVPNALTPALFGDGAVAQKKLTELTTKIARWVITDHALRIVMAYPSSVLESLYPDGVRGFRHTEPMEFGRVVDDDLWNGARMSEVVVPILTDLTPLIDPDNLVKLHEAFMTRSLSALSGPAEVWTSAILNSEYSDVAHFGKKYKGF